MIRGALRELLRVGLSPSRSGGDASGRKALRTMDEDAETHHDDEDAAVDADGAAAAAAAAGDDAEK